MPHIVIEYSRALEDGLDMQRVCEDVFRGLSKHAAIGDPATLKVRAVPVDYSYIGTTPNSFVHATLLLLSGRDADEILSLNKAVAVTLGQAFGEVGSITVTEREMSKQTYIKMLAG